MYVPVKKTYVMLLYVNKLTRYLLSGDVVALTGVL